MPFSDDGALCLLKPSTSWLDPSGETIFEHRAMLLSMGGLSDYWRPRHSINSSCGNVGRPCMRLTPLSIILVVAAMVAIGGPLPEDQLAEKNELPKLFPLPLSNFERRLVNTFGDPCAVSNPSQPSVSIQVPQPEGWSLTG